jgi:hypothetical protein
LLIRTHPGSAFERSVTLMSGHQHDKEPVHDLGKGQADKGENEPGDKDKEAGGGRREHRASGSHDSNITDAGRDYSTSSSGGGSQGGGGGSHGGGRKEGD